MGPHIDSAVKKCHGLLGMLRRAADYLPRELLKLVYTSVIRSHLEYCSATFIHSAPTHLNKLDIIQKIASRIITGSSSMTHSAPLQLQLGLDSLHVRRLNHVATLVEDILAGKSHPHFNDFFTDTDGTPVVTTSSRKLDSKRFRCFGTKIYNERKNRV